MSGILSMIFGAILKMSLQGTIIIVIIMCLRLLMKILRISHKYAVLLWLIVFFYLVFPWKLSMPVGFWEKISVSEQLQSSSENTVYGEEDTLKDAQIHSGTVVVSHVEALAGTESAVQVRDLTGEESAEYTNEPIKAEDKEEAIETGKNENIRGSILPYVWFLVLAGFVARFTYLYLIIRKKLLVCIPYKENIYWAEDIMTPMVFGMVHPRIYLPVSIEEMNLRYVIAHEEMHMRRKDSIIKMLAYMICMLHWFNPFVWAAYAHLGSDIEKACDEEVIKSLGEESKKEYAYTLLQMAAADVSAKKRLFVAPVCFGEGDVKGRIRNILKYKYTLPGIGAVILVIGLAFAVLFATEKANGDQEDQNSVSDEAENIQTGEASDDLPEKESSSDTGKDSDEGIPVEKIPVFYVAEENVLQVADSFRLEDYYITSRYSGSNHFYIDEAGVLWGSGRNEFGQLGTGTYGYEEYYEEPVKIAEDVISVDASWNDYFCIYLTEGGELYGVGMNFAGILLGSGSEEQVYSIDGYKKVTEPVLLMEDVAYARAGRESIVALKTDKTAYWWGQFCSINYMSTDAVNQDYWALDGDVSNPAKMQSSDPVKIMDDCKYITTGTYTGAAICENGDLYTWGLNAFGECGTAVTEDEFVRTPVKVMEQVKMVWVEKLQLNDSMESPPDLIRRDMNYPYNIFVLTEKSELLAAGENIGENEEGEFLPVMAMVYSETVTRDKLTQLSFGLSMDAAEALLEELELDYFRVAEDGMVYLSLEDSRYLCYFDEQQRLTRFKIQEGGSRDNRFQIDMNFEDLQTVVDEAGGILAEESDDIWTYEDTNQNILYRFYIYEAKVYVLSEELLEEIQTVRYEVTNPSADYYHEGNADQKPGSRISLTQNSAEENGVTDLDD